MNHTIEKPAGQEAVVHLSWWQGVGLLPSFNPYDGYWLAQDGCLYSSARQMLVQETDPDFMTWKEAGQYPTPWPKDREGNQTGEALAHILDDYNLKLWPPTLDEIRISLKKQVNRQAEEERQKYITEGTGQALTYREKAEEAIDYSLKLAAHKANPQKPAPDPALYPFLQACLGIEGDTLAEVAETVTYHYALWQQAGAAIEAKRVAALSAVEEAQTVDEAQAVLDAFSP